MAHLFKNKVILLILINFLTINFSYSQELLDEGVESIEYLPKKTSEQTKKYSKNVLEEPAVDDVNYFSKKEESVLEWAVTFVRFGQSLSTDSLGVNSTNTMGSFGYRRIANNFIYGLEYSSHYTNKNIRSVDVDFNLGFRPNIKYKVVPYLIGGFGHTIVTDNSGDGKDSGKGINYFIDLGIELFKLDVLSAKMITTSGVKLTHQKVTGGSLNSMDFLDLYWGIGLSW